MWPAWLRVRLPSFYLIDNQGSGGVDISKEIGIRKEPDPTLQCSAGRGGYAQQTSVGPLATLQSHREVRRAAANASRLWHGGSPFLFSFTRTRRAAGGNATVQYSIIDMGTQVSPPAKVLRGHHVSIAGLAGMLPLFDMSNPPPHTIRRGTIGNKRWRWESNREEHNPYAWDFAIGVDDEWAWKNLTCFRVYPGMGDYHMRGMWRGGDPDAIIEACLNVVRVIMSIETNPWRPGFEPGNRNW